VSSRVKKGRRVTKPSGQRGVSIDRAGPDIFLTFEDVGQSTVIELSVSNATMVRDLLSEAIEKGEEPKVDITLASGLIVPAAGPRAIP
jgi:hypothetical protein